MHYRCDLNTTGAFTHRRVHLQSGQPGLFSSREQAEVAAKRNGFRFHDSDSQAEEPAENPEPPFWEGLHPDGRIYSSGLFWISPRVV